MQRRWLVGALPVLFAATRGLAQEAASAAAPGRRTLAMSLVSDKLSTDAPLELLGARTAAALPHILEA